MIRSVAYDDAVALLVALSGSDGIHASLAGPANYRAVFARDAVMAGIAGLLVENDAIASGLVRTLEQLRALQGRQGQIASNYELRTGLSAVASFGTLAPRLDAATWYLLGIAAGARAGALDPGAFHSSATAVVNLLDGIEYNGRHLLYVPQGGNWADEYVYEGYILYDQVLRAWALRLLAETFAEPAWSAKSTEIGRTIGERFWPPDTAEPARPVATVSPTGHRDTFDLAACALLALSNLAAPRGATALEWLARRFLDRGELPPAFHPIIDEHDPEWAALQRYHLHGFRNQPHEYHNGGVWPIWLGWLALALASAGKIQDVACLQDLVTARIAGAGRWRFEEYFHGLTGKPGGISEMAYSATGVVFLHLAGSPRVRQLLG